MFQALRDGPAPPVELASGGQVQVRADASNAVELDISNRPETVVITERTAGREERNVLSREFGPDGAGVEVALAWPLVGDRVGQELIVADGTRDRVIVTPERVFRHAIRLGASAVVLSHNHVAATGPSDADHAVPRRLVAAGHLLGVPLLASLVIEPDTVHDLVTARSWRGAPIGAKRHVE